MNKQKDAKARLWMPIGPNGPGGPEARFDREDLRNVGGGTGPTGQSLPYFVWSIGATGLYMSPGMNLAGAGTANPLVGAITVPKDGTLAFATLKDVQLSGVGDMTVTLYKEGVATLMQVVLGVGSLAFDNVNTVAVARGDRVQAFVDVNNGKALPQFMVLLT